jgi:hypothetical protein
MLTLSADTFGALIRTPSPILRRRCGFRAAIDEAMKNYDVDELPPFLPSQNLKPIISKELMMSNLSGDVSKGEELRGASASPSQISEIVEQAWGRIPHATTKLDADEAKASITRACEEAVEWQMELRQGQEKRHQRDSTRQSHA